MKGILFTEPMFRAVVAGSKTQTRRIISAEDIGDFLGFENDPDLAIDGDLDNIKHRKGLFTHFDEGSFRVRYQPGDIIYLKEPYGFLGSKLIYRYLKRKIENILYHNKMFMPAKYARYFIRIKDVRVERANDISKEDAKAEGVEPGRFLGFGAIGQKSYKEGFLSVFYGINKKLIPSSNPFVFAYTFELTEKPKQ